MKALFSPRKMALALAMVSAFGLTACQTTTRKVDGSGAVVMQPSSPDNLIQRELEGGVQQMVYLFATNTLYIARAQAAETVSGGMIYRLDATTLQSRGAGHFDLKNVGLIGEPDGSALYATNAFDGAITEIDPENGRVLKRLILNEKDQSGQPAHPHEILLHDGLLYVGDAGDSGVIWVVQAKTLKLKARMTGAGKAIGGLLFSPVSDRIYATNGSGEILVINPRNHRIEQRLTAGDGQSDPLLNMAEDPATGRLFVTARSRTGQAWVFDERSGRVIQSLVPGDSQGIKFNGKRNEIYLSQRESKKVLQLDGTTYDVKNSWSFGGHPENLLVTPDGQTLFVTLKQGSKEDSSGQSQDGVARINLQ
ncbi:YncE family protein [uncultured Pantoea sp.]|uniref:YncE family protein n=1 Tax=uncultured Pantoea sp. TaxID=218084 RepID=UPI0025D93C5E|nr:YncE family protein [uncultured Pantoea sp.]